MYRTRKSVMIPNWPKVASLTQKKLDTSAVFSCVNVFTALKVHACWKIFILLTWLAALAISDVFPQPLSPYNIRGWSLFPSTYPCEINNNS